MTEQISNSQFLEELFKGAQSDDWLWVVNFTGSPEHGNWSGQPWRPSNQNASQVDDWSLFNTYFSVGSLQAINHDVRRQKKHFSALLSLTLDDVNLGDLQASPSYVIETSPGKSQAGFFLDADDEDRRNERLVTLLVTKMASRGLVGIDKSGNNCVRLSRLPVGQNQKARPTGHFDVRLTHWSPSVRYTLEDAAASVGIDLDALKAELAAIPESRPILTGLVADGTFEERMAVLTQNVLLGADLHDSINQLAAMKVRCGTAPGAIVTELRTLMQMSMAPRDERWQGRFDDIARSVSTAEEKYRTHQVASAPAVPEPTEEESQAAVKATANEMPEHLLKPGGALQLYIDWNLAGAPRPQPVLALAAGLACLSTALGRMVMGETGLRTNMYLLSVAPTGAGKEWGRKCNIRALSEAGLGDLLGGDEIASSAGLIGRMVEYPSTLCQPDEFGLLLQEMKSKGASTHKAALIAVMMKLFGLGDGVFKGTEYADRKDKARKDIPNPCLNLHATTTASELLPALSGRDVASGFVNRLLVFWAPEERPGRQRPIPAGPPAELTDWLRAAGSLAAETGGNLGSVMGTAPPIVYLSGPAGMQMDAFEDWVEKQMAAHTQDGTDALYSRLVEHAWKLAIVAACSQYHAEELSQLAASGQLEIDPASMSWAIGLVRHLAEKLLAKLAANMGENDFDRLRLEVLRVIGKEGPRGLTKRELGLNSRPFRALKPREQDEVLEAATRSGEAVLVPYEAASNGKQRLAYVSAASALPAPVQAAAEPGQPGLGQGNLTGLPQ